jgi:hypothetical protein
MAIDNKKLELRKIISALIAEYERATRAEVEAINIVRGKNTTNKQKEQIPLDVEIITSYTRGSKKRKN